MKVIVIGAGIIGLLTALRLKQAGVDVTILEKGEVGREASWAGAGILCPIHPWLYPVTFTDLVQASLDLYPALQDEFANHVGYDIQRIQSGLLIPCFADDKIKHQAAALAWSKQFGWDVQQLDTQEALELEPTLSPHVAEALLWKDVCQVRNPELIKATILCLEQLQVPIISNCEVSSLIEHANGDVAGVKTKSGQSYNADVVLLAAGSWSERLAEQSGFALPVHPVKGQIVLLKTEPNTLKHIVKHDDAYFVPRRDGRILVGASMENVGFERGNTPAIVQDLMHATQKLLPELKDAPIEHQWMGFRPGSPDGLPFIGKVKNKPGLWVATGHYRNGVALAPITAKVITDGILGKTSSIDLTAFSPEREILIQHPLGYSEA
ncbi:MAG: glycine oxidase ThiO [Ghiorsea sp.]